MTQVTLRPHQQQLVDATLNKLKTDQFLESYKILKNHNY